MEPNLKKDRPSCYERSEEDGSSLHPILPVMNEIVDKKCGEIPSTSMKNLSLPERCLRKKDQHSAKPSSALRISTRKTKNQGRPRRHTDLGAKF